MTRAKHRPPSRLTVARVAVADGAVLAFGLTFAVATSVAPHAHAPVTVAAPTAVDLREPTGHGGPIGPVTGPSFAADVPVWNEDKGPVIVNGQALARPTGSPEFSESFSEPEPIPEPSPTPTPAPEPPVAPATTAEPTPPPVVVAPEPTEPEVTEPEVTEPDVTPPVETTPPTEPPAEPTEPVVEVTP